MFLEYVPGGASPSSVNSLSFFRMKQEEKIWADTGDGMSYLSLLHSMTQAKQKILPLAAYVNQTSGHYTTNEERLSEYWKNA